MRQESTEYEEAYTLLVHLCEQQQTLADEALLYVMEAFNGLSEISTPAQLLSPREMYAVDRLRRVLELLDGLVAGSHDLARTLELLQVRGLVDAALDVQR